MSEKKNEVLHLLTVLESDNEADSLASMLKDAALSLQTENVKTPEELEAALEKQSWDIIVHSFCTPDIEADDGLEIIKQAGSEASIIIVTDDFNVNTQLDMLQKGARAYISNKKSELAVLEIRNEYEKILMYRRCLRAEAQVEESEQRNQSLMNSSRDAIAYLTDGMHVYSNQTYLEMFGFDNPDDIEAIPVMDLIASEDQGNFKNILKDMLKGQYPEEEFKFIAERSDGEKFDAIMEFSDAHIHGEPCTQIIIRSNVASQKELEELRRKDQLTDIYNRNYFTEKLDDIVAGLIADSEKPGGAVVYIDLDGFKEISEKIGVADSDLVLRDFAQILLNYIGDSDIAARYAGDIFTLILNEPDLDKVKEIAGSVSKGLAAHKFAIKEESFKCTASIGIVQLSENSESSAKVLSQAESACNVAKSNGGNDIYAYTLADEKAKDEHDQKWVHRINNALKQDLFYLLYQPVVSLHGKQGQRYEVSIMMKDENGDDIPPEDFMHIAEETGLQMEIDRWIIENAAKDILKHKNNKGLQLFVSISPEAIGEKSFLVWLNKLIKANKLPPNTLVFKISEAIVTKSPAKAKAFITNLQKIGCTSAIDQAGHAKELFTFLKIVDTSYLVIDPYFTSSLTTSEQSQEIVRTITTTAKRENIMSIAGNANDAGSVAVLYQTDLDFIQGDYLQAPDRSLSYDFS